MTAGQRLGLFIVIAMGTLLATACGKPSDPRDFDTFARQVESAMERRDGVFFGVRAQTELRTCPDRELILCIDVDDGGKVRTFPVDTGNQVNQVPIADYIGGFVYWLDIGRDYNEDELGDGAPRLLAVARSVEGGVEERHTVLTEIPNAPLGGEGTRIARVLDWRRQGERWVLVGEKALDYQSPPELLTAWLKGDCPACYEDWRLWAAVSTPAP